MTLKNMIFESKYRACTFSLTLSCTPFCSFWRVIIVAPTHVIHKMKGNQILNNFCLTFFYQKLWSKGPNLLKSALRGLHFVRHFGFVFVICNVQSEVIYQMKGLFKLYNNDLALLYWKVLSKGRKSVKIENIAAILKNIRLWHQGALPRWPYS